MKNKKEIKLGKHNLLIIENFEIKYVLDYLILLPRFRSKIWRCKMRQGGKKVRRENHHLQFINHPEKKEFSHFSSLHKCKEEKIVT